MRRPLSSKGASVPGEWWFGQDMKGEGVLHSIKYLVCISDGGGYSLDSLAWGASEKAIAVSRTTAEKMLCRDGWNLRLRTPTNVLSERLDASKHVS